MDNWVCDDSIFISRSIGSSDGVVQVYKLWSTNIPMGEDSFIFIGEEAGPSAIAPLVQWQRRDYGRLLDFIQVNSLMVNASGCVILKSAAKSRIAGRPDGSTTYWRCLDILPMQVYGLLKPHDKGIKPNFLIIGGDVDQLGTISENTEIGDWKAKYESLDAAFRSLESELTELKVRLRLADKSLIACQGEKNKMVNEMEKLELSNQQLKNSVKATEDEKKKLINELEKLVNEAEVESKKAREEKEILKAEASDLESRLRDITSKLTVAEESLTVCRGEKKKLVNEVEKLVGEMEVEKQKARDGLEKLKDEISDLKARLDVADKFLIACQGEKKILVSEVEKLVGEMEVEKQKARDELEKLKAEILDQKARLDVGDKSLISCQGENKKLASVLEKLKSSNELERKQAIEERNKLTAEISNLKSQLRNTVTRSVMDNNLEKEKDSSTLIYAKNVLLYGGYTGLAPSFAFASPENLKGGWDTKFTQEGRMCGRLTIVDADWNVYRAGANMYAITVGPYNKMGTVWNTYLFGRDNTRRLVLRNF